MLTGIKAKLVDVFAEKQLTGNGLTIFWKYPDLSSEDMLALTREMRQFESIFVQHIPDTCTAKARIFTMEEELAFAGHPLIGLAAHLHEEYGTNKQHEWEIELKYKRVSLVSRTKGSYYSVAMNQGVPEFLRELAPSENHKVLSALNLKDDDAADLPITVVSTGLPYLIVPVEKGIENAGIIHTGFESLIASYGAKFVYVLDINTFEGRSWDNEGKVEDITTGSAAGPAGAFLFKAGLVSANTPFHIRQGRYVDRPSKIEVRIEAAEGTIKNITVSGNVYKTASISFG